MSSLEQSNTSVGLTEDEALETQEWLDALDAVLDREGP